jgi:hypothetical protein
VVVRVGGRPVRVSAGQEPPGRVVGPRLELDRRPRREPRLRLLPPSTHATGYG